MIEIITEMMSHIFIQRAVLVGILISVCAALLGVNLVLKRYSMIGDRAITCRLWNNDNFSGFWSNNTTIHSNSTELQYVRFFC